MRHEEVEVTVRVLGVRVYVQFADFFFFPAFWLLAMRGAVSVMSLIATGN